VTSMSSQSSVTPAALQAAGIIPDGLPASHPAASSSLLSLAVIFESSGAEVLQGNTLTPTAAFQPPRFSLPAGLAAGQYSIVELDLDPPSRRRPRFRSALHLLQVNVPNTAAEVSAAGNLHCEYGPPGPPQNSGKHRYCFFLYRQSDNVDVAKLPPYAGLSGRGKQSLEAVERALTEAGAGQLELVAVNWSAVQAGTLSLSRPDASVCCMLPSARSPPLCDCCLEVRGRVGRAGGRVRETAIRLDVPAIQAAPALPHLRDDDRAGGRAGAAQRCLSAARNHVIGCACHGHQHSPAAL
jgi:hypothetical protein